VQFVEKWVKKGSGLYVEGKIRNRSYDDQSGVKRYITEIYADRIEFYSSGFGNREGNSNSQNGTETTGSGYQAATDAETYSVPTASTSESTDDLPF
jgi:single-strand DNA-binding protein